MKTRHFALKLTFLTVIVTLISCEPKHFCTKPIPCSECLHEKPLLTGAQRQLSLIEETIPDKYEILYSTSDTSIATITSTGRLIGKKPGNVLVHVQVTRPICGCHWECDYNFVVSDTLQLDRSLEEEIITRWGGDTNHDGVITSDEMNKIETISIENYSELLYTIPNVKYLNCYEMNLDLNLVPNLYALDARDVKITNIPPDNQVACLILFGKSVPSLKNFSKLNYLYVCIDDHYYIEDENKLTIDDITAQPEVVFNISNADNIRYVAVKNRFSYHKNIHVIVSQNIHDRFGDVVFSLDSKWQDREISSTANTLEEKDYPFLFHPFFESICGQTAWVFENKITFDFTDCFKSLVQVTE